MATKKPSCKEHRKLQFQKGLLSPEDCVVFTREKSFDADWESLNLDDEALRALETAIMADPSGPAVVPGTGGLRKVRFTPESWGTGKSGAARICYVYFEDLSQVFLLLAYSKGHRETLTAKEKQIIKKLIGEIEKKLKR